tara:strand:+ start:4323 stop:4988 length:666 start_codon:yes stop_codon:yes gene_type:complete
MNKLIIIGTGLTAELAYEYFTHDSPYEVVAFSAEEKYIIGDKLFGLPIVPFEQIYTLYPPAEFTAFVSITFTKMNRLRERLYNQTKEKGYRLANYISSNAFVWGNVALGDNNFILEDNTIQPFVTIGNNNILWSGNHIGHHSSIGDHNFISSHVVISGNCRINNYCFFGVNSTLGDAITIKNDCWFSPNTITTKNVKENTLLMIGAKSTPFRKGAKEFFKI